MSTKTFSTDISLNSRGPKLFSRYKIFHFITPLRYPLDDEDIPVSELLELAEYLNRQKITQKYYTLQFGNALVEDKIDD